MGSFQDLKDFAAGAALAAAFGVAGLLASAWYINDARSQIALAAHGSVIADRDGVSAEARALRHRPALVHMGDASEAQP